MNAHGFVEWVDRAQRGRRPAGFAVAVVKKYGDDRGSTLAAMLTFYGLLTIFPLLLLLTTVLGYFLGANESLTRHVLDSSVVDFPIIGTQLTQSIHSLHGSLVAVTIGALGLLWGALGATQVAQHTMAEVWSIPVVARPGFLERVKRGLLLLAVLGSTVAVTAALTAGVAAAGASPAVRGVGIALAVAANAGLALAGLRVATPRPVPTGDLVPGAVVAGVGWSVLQLLGSLLVGHYLHHASEVYGYFGSVLGLIAWLSLGAQLVVYSAEVNVVKARRLWPRALVPPPRTGADARVLVGLAEKEARVEDEEIVVRLGSSSAGRGE